MLGVVGPALTVAVLVVASARPSPLPPGRAGDVHPQPVDLAAAAPDVEGRPWLARRSDDRWEWGEAGRAGRHLLPTGEAGLAVNGSWLLSTTANGEVSRLIVRDRGAGRASVDVDLPFWASAGAITDGMALVTGYGDSSMASDAGLWLLDIATGERRSLIPGGPFDPRLGSNPMRGEVHVSPDGRLAAVNVCGRASCTTQVVDIGRGRSYTVADAQAGFLRAVTDDSVVFTDGEGRWVRAVDARSGKERYTIPNTSLMRPVAVGDGSVVASLGSGDRGWHLGSIGANGTRRELTSPDPESWPKVWPQVSSPTTVVYGDVSFEEALGRGGDVAGRLLRAPGLSDLGSAVVILDSREP